MGVLVHSQVFFFFFDLAQHYHAAVQGVPADIPELPVQYGDFAHWQAAMV